MKFLTKIFAFVALIAIVGGGFNYLSNNSKSTASGSTSSAAKVVFGDGSYATINTVSGWCHYDMVSGFVSTLASSRGSQKSLDYIYNTNCKKMETDAGMIVAFAHDFPSSVFCKGRGGKKIDMGAPAGYVSLCSVEVEVSKGVPTGEVISANYPVSARKTVQIIADSDLWQKKNAEILNMLKTTKYVGGAQ